MKAATGVFTVSLILAQVYAVSGYSDNSVQKRDDTPSEGVNYLKDSFYDLPYTVNVQVGSEKTTIRLVLDTGYADTVLLASNNTYCDTQSCMDAVYDFETSTSYKSYNDMEFYATYEYEKYAEGIWATDNFYYLDETITNVTFGISYNGTLTTGKLGLGVDIGQEDKFYIGRYDGFVTRLEDAGLIQKRAYSTYLINLDAGYGNILYGALNKVQYSGDLWTIPLISTSPDTEVPYYFAVAGDIVQYSTGDCNLVAQNGSYIVYFDTGYVETDVPSGVYEAVMASLNADDNDQFSCNAVTDQYITYYLSGIPVKGYLSQMMYKVSDDLCGLHMVENDSGYITLGCSFLNSLMVVYDLENLEVSVAQATHYDGPYNDDDIELIVRDVPGAKPYSEYVATTDAPVCTSTSSAATTTSASTVSSTSGVSSTSSTSPSASSASSSSSSSSSSSTSFSATTTVTNSSSVYPTSSASAGFSNSSVSTASATLSTYVYTSVSGTLTITGTSVITVCPVCEEKTATSSTSSSVVVAATTTGSVDVTVIEGKTITVPCTLSTPSAMAPASTSMAPVVSEDMTVIVVEGVTITVPCSEVSSVPASATVASVLPAISENVSTGPVAAASNSTMAPIEGSAISAKSFGLTTLLYAFIATLII